MSINPFVASERHNARFERDRLTLLTSELHARSRRRPGHQFPTITARALREGVRATDSKTRRTKIELLKARIELNGLLAQHGAREAKFRQARRQLVALTFTPPHTLRNDRRGIGRESHGARTTSHQGSRRTSSRSAGGGSGGDEPHSEPPSEAGRGQRTELRHIGVVLPSVLAELEQRRDDHAWADLANLSADDEVAA